MPTAAQLLLWHTVNREHIDIDTSEIPQMKTFDECCCGILNLSERQGITFVGLAAHKLHLFWQPLPGMGYQLLIVGTGHGNVDIIIPWDKPLMSHGSEYRACPDIIGESMLFTGSIDSRQDIKYAVMKLFDIVVGHGLLKKKWIVLPAQSSDAGTRLLA